MYYVYIIRSIRLGVLYTGYTSDIINRIKKHNNGTGAKYTRGRGPFDLVYSETFEDKSSAMKREYAIKQLSKSQKMELIEIYQILDTDTDL